MVEPGRSFVLTLFVFSFFIYKKCCSFFSLEVEDFADIALMIFPREGRLWNFGGHTNTRTLPYSEYMGWEGRERQCGNGPHPSVLMEINNLEIRSQLTKSRHTFIF